jgi:abortive infection bacteriophage resistance protein
MLPYLKPFRTTHSNIEILRLRGMDLGDEDHAIRCISRIGYYRLSAYWYPFRDFCELPAEGGRFVRCDRFVAGTTFSQAFGFYLFDKEIRLMLSDALERIEIGMRAAVVEVLGARGSHAHRDPRSYGASLTTLDPSTGLAPLDAFLTGLDDAFRRSKEEYAKHFRGAYSGHPPIWIAAGGWDWGNLAHVVSHLSTANIDAVCNMIDPRLGRKTLISWMTSLNEVRNACAHHSRLWNKVLTNRPGFQRNGELAEFDHMRGPDGKVVEHYATRLYGGLVAIVFLMKWIHPRTEWHLRFAQRVTAEPLSKEISSAAAGFPEDWYKAPMWQ